MVRDFNAAEFLALTPAEQVRKCRQLAQEAEKLAASGADELRGSFTDIARHWSRLADEIERMRRR